MQTNVTHETSKNGVAKADKATTPVLTPHVLIPTVDVLESAEDILVLANLPGVRAEDLTLHLEKELLTLVAERQGAGGERPIQYKRTFQVPAELDREGIEARTEDGVLTLRFPRRASAKPRNIPVKPMLSSK